MAWGKERRQPGESIPINVVAPTREPTILDKLESELWKIQAEIHDLECQITAKNSKAVEMSSQIAWLKRTPQAQSILASLAERFGK